MGDIADYLIEQGFDARADHDAKQCGDDCEYCRAEEREREYRQKWRRFKQRQKERYAK